MALFERTDIRELSERLLALAEGRGILLSSAAGQELNEMLMNIRGIQPVGRGAKRRLNEAGREFLIKKLKETDSEPSWYGEDVLVALAGRIPCEINNATLSGLWLGDCKATLSQAQLAVAEMRGIRVFSDETIRLRTDSALSLVWQDGRRYCAQESLNTLGEIALPERALTGLQEIEWQGQQIITVENKGAFMDYPLKERELLLYVPGRNTVLAKQIIPLLPASIPWAHFGDLDQRGLDIAAGLALAINRPLSLWLPDNLMEYIQHYERALIRKLDGQRNQRGKIPWRQLECRSNNALFAVLDRLRTNRTWMEQEVLVSARHWISWPLVDSTV